MILLKFILVVILLLAMIIVILGVGHLFSGNFNTSEEEASRLRRDLENKDEVITRDNVFHSFLKADDSSQNSRTGHSH